MITERYRKRHVNAVSRYFNAGLPTGLQFCIIISRVPVAREDVKELNKCQTLQVQGTTT
jgi:hypothetical protein